MKKYLVLILLICACFSKLVFSQTLNINQFGIEEGLPQSGIYTMVHDKYGNIWIGTMAGVSKYNGLRFENFDKKNGLAENRVTSSLIDKAGNIWFGHWSGGLTKYSFKTKAFHEVTTKNIEIEKAINNLFQDIDGNIWISTSGNGLVKYVPSASELKGDTAAELGSFSQLTEKEGLSNNYVTGVIQDKSKTIWISTEKGITKLLKDEKIEYFTDSLISKSSVSAILIDANKNLWIGTTNRGIYKYNFETNEIKNYNISHGLASNYVKVIFEDARKNIFIGTYGAGVSKYLPSLELNNYQGPIFQTISTYQGLSNDKVLCISQDRENNIWIGTYINLNQYFDEQFEIFGEQEGLVNSLVWSMIQDREGNFWLGTEGGLVKFIEDANSNKSKFQYFNDSKEIKITNTTALYEDAWGDIWYTNFSAGLYKLNPKSGNIISYNASHGVLSNEIYGIADDKDSNIWVGTNGAGVAKFDRNTQKFTSYKTDDGLGSNQVYTIYKDSRQNLWFGCLAGNLTMFDGNTFKTFSAKEGYNSNFTLCIAEDNQGNMWFGTYGNGIYKYDGKTFKNYSTKEGANTDAPYLLAYDNNSNLWIGTGIGIDKFNIRDEKFKHYDKQDGFLGIEINPNAVCKDKNGNIWFGTIIGLVKYTSKREKNNLIPPVITLKNPRVLFNEFEVPKNNKYSYFDNHLTFDFVGASLTNPKRVKYKYMMEGLDQSWSPETKQTYATYPDLKPGKYTFKVIACNNDGVWNEEPVTFSFTIAPPFWKTWWFYTIVALAIALITYGYILYREGALKRENKILEEKVQIRTQQLSEEKKKSDNLLLNILPAETAEELKEKGKATPRSYNLATVLFTDFKGFTSIAEKLTPEQLIEELDVCFAKFDEITMKYNIEKIKTIGDAYMCVGGVPIRNKGNPIHVTLAAIEIIDFMSSMREEKIAQNKPYWELRLGLHSGPIVAGVVGKKKFAYDVWGDSVNTASRMESSGEPGKINISGATYELIKDYFDCTHRGKIAAKNKGQIEMYFVDRIKLAYSQDKEGRVPNETFKKLIQQL